MQDIIRIIRMVEYIGPRDLVEEQVSKSLHGSRTLRERFYPGEQYSQAGYKRSSDAMVIRATTVGEFPEIVLSSVPEEQEADAMTAIKKELDRGIDSTETGG